MKNTFKHPELIKAASIILDNADYEGDVNHMYLSLKYSNPLAATIQSGYWPDWLEVDKRCEIELKAHLEKLWGNPYFGTTQFAGWYYPF